MAHLVTQASASRLSPEQCQSRQSRICCLMMRWPNRKRRMHLRRTEYSPADRSHLPRYISIPWFTLTFHPDCRRSSSTCECRPPSYLAFKQTWPLGNRPLKMRWPGWKLYELYVLGWQIKLEQS
jgi:hypothetical protein